jgi:plastocyanin
MKELRDRVLVPLAIPLGAALVIVFVILNFSRVLLALEERSSATAATFVAIAVASAVLFGSTYFSARGEDRSAGNLTVLASAGLALVVAGFIGLAALQEEQSEAAAEAKKKAAEAGPVAATVTAFDIGFRPKEVQVPAGKPRIELVNDGATLHTMDIEGVPGFHLEVASKGAKAVKEADLKPGSYVFFCDVPGHRQGGMEGTLTVTEGGGGASAAGGQAGAGRVDVTAGEMFFKPKELTAPGGPVQVSLKNEGTLAHTLLVDGVVKFQKLAADPGKTQSGTLDVGPGEYVLYCEVPGHRQAGMEAKLKVG